MLLEKLIRFQYFMKTIQGSQGFSVLCGTGAPTLIVALCIYILSGTTNHDRISEPLSRAIEFNLLD